MKNARVDSKKNLILAAWDRDERDLWKISAEAETTLSYVANVLRSAGRIEHYRDLFTSGEPENVYSALLRGRLGFKDVEAARASVKILQETYELFEGIRERAGQHETMVAALTLYHRALSSRKAREAEVFRAWLTERLAADALVTAEMLRSIDREGAKPRDRARSVIL